MVGGALFVKVIYTRLHLDAHPRANSLVINKAIQLHSYVDATSSSDVEVKNAYIQIIRKSLFEESSKTRISKVDFSVKEVLPTWIIGAT